ncbi:hypothetical protein Tco_0899944 [Tanacetum coccineum]
MEAIKELSVHSLSWYNEGNIQTENKEFQTVLNQINNFEDDINIMTEEVRMAQHKYETPMDGRISKLEETLNNFIKESRLRQMDSENMVWGIKKTCEQTLKTQASSIKEIEIHLGGIYKHPVFEAFEQMPKYAKFMKDLLAIKGKTEETSKLVLNERCSTVLQNKIPFKEKDPGSFTIPCVVGKVGINKALADLGASISLMPYSMYARLDLGEIKPTRMCIELANKSTQYLRGIAENVIVKIDKFIFHVDFAVLDMKEDHKIPIILGRPFLATAHAMIDVFIKKISFEVGNETITFDIEKSMKFLQLKMTNEEEEDDSEYLDKSGLPSYPDNWEPIRPTLFSTNSIEAEKQPPKFKELPSHLEYAFLKNNQEFPVIISSLLNT